MQLARQVIVLRWNPEKSGLPRRQRWSPPWMVGMVGRVYRRSNPAMLQGILLAEPTEQIATPSSRFPSRASTCFYYPLPSFALSTQSLVHGGSRRWSSQILALAVLPSPSNTKFEGPLLAMKEKYLRSTSGRKSTSHYVVPNNHLPVLTVRQKL